MELLEAANEIGTVKRVVFVSSISAVTGPVRNCTNKTYTEEDWPDMGSLPLKCKGKLNVCRELFIIFSIVYFQCKLGAHYGINSSQFCTYVSKPV